MPDTFVYGPNSWGQYYTSVTVKHVAVEALTTANTLALYLYGETARPDDPSKYIRAVDSNRVAVIVDMGKFMQGAGTLMRAAATREYALFSDFFEGRMDASFKDRASISTEATLSTIEIISDAGFDVSEKYDTKFSYQHVYYQNRANWKEETFIWNSVGWDINKQAQFKISFDENGNVIDRSITGLKFTASDNENYDYQTGSGPKSDISKYIHGEYHDPFNIGKKFDIKFSQAETFIADTVAGETWTQATFDRYLAQANQWVSGTNAVSRLQDLSNWALLGEEIAASLSGENGPLKYQKDGHALLLGTALDDAIQSSVAFDETLFYAQYGNGFAFAPGQPKSRLFPDQYVGQIKGDYIYSGAGDDTLYGSNYNDVFYGGDGSDAIYGYSGYDEAGLEKRNNRSVSLFIDLASIGIALITRQYGVKLLSPDDELNGDQLFDIEKFTLSAKNDTVQVGDFDATKLSRLSVDLGGGVDEVRFLHQTILVNGVKDDSRAPSLGWWNTLTKDGYTGALIKAAQTLKDISKADAQAETAIKTALQNATPYNETREGIDFQHAEKITLSDDNDEFYVDLASDSDLYQVNGGGGDDVLFARGAGADSRLTLSGGTGNDNFNSTRRMAA
jgi:hypothetical protein